MLTRWDEWYSDENLSTDGRILAAPPTKSAELAAMEFGLRKKRRILDLACGVGRDSFYLVAAGLSTIGADASWNGLAAALKSMPGKTQTLSFVNADARILPFENSCFDGVYCFGLLHEFTCKEKDIDVASVITEVKRVLNADGILVLTVAAGDPSEGLPQVQLFSREMFEQTMTGWHTLVMMDFDDVGCTNRSDYHIWYGVFGK